MKRPTPTPPGSSYDAATRHAVPSQKNSPARILLLNAHLPVVYFPATQHIVYSNSLRQQTVWLDHGKTNTVRAYNAQNELIGNMQYTITGNTFSISSIDAGTAYPGLGSLMIRAALDRFPHIAFVAANNIVGSFGYWKKLGLDIPPEYLFDTAGMPQEEVRKRNDEIKLQQFLKRKSAGTRQAEYAVFSANLDRELQAKGWKY
jgi:hypothetical protein